VYSSCNFNNNNKKKKNSAWHVKQVALDLCVVEVRSERDGERAGRSAKGRRQRNRGRRPWLTRPRRRKKEE
jgi:hypothetical protein